MNRKYKHIILRFFVITITLTLAWMHDSCTLNSEADEHYENPPDRNSDYLLTLISENQNYSRFYNALIDYGFEDLLSKNQYFTVFVPPNSAFDGLPEYSTSEWVKIIGFHIVYANLFSKDFSNRNMLTFNGKYLKMRQIGENDFKIFESTVNLSNVDNYCQNGVIHEIDKLLIPKPNLYEYIMELDSSYSILQNFLISMDSRYIDYEKSERIGVNNNGDPIYDTVWKTENYFLDNIAGLNDEDEAYTGFIPSNADVNTALNSIASYFGNISEMDQETYNQLLFIAFSGSFTRGAYTHENLPDTIVSVTGKTLSKSLLSFNEINLEMSNGIIHILDRMVIPKSFFLTPIVIECDQKENRRISNTIYSIEQLSDSRATNGSYVCYGCKFVGDYIEFTVSMVFKTTYWFTWTGPKQGPSHYQLFVKDDITGEFINVGEPVNNWTKIAWQPVVAGTYTFSEFGTKTIRFIIVDELPVIGFNAIYVDYIKLTPDEIYEP
jgi:uncharacterized surface protein with fasciclin (FAS1) repeats